MQIGASTVKHRNMVLVVLLSIFLPVIFWLYWYVATANELRRSDAGNPRPWIGIIGIAFLSIMVAVWVTVTNILDGGIAILFWLLSLFTAITLLIFVIAAIINYWHSIKLISSRYQDDYAIALLCAIFYASVPFIFLAMPALVVIPAIFFIIFITLAQIELNGYSAVYKH